VPSEFRRGIIVAMPQVCVGTYSGSAQTLTQLAAAPEVPRGPVSCDHTPITPQMVQAGVDAFMALGFEEYDSFAESITRAILEAALSRTDEVGC
jgi:hypothetical protein